jgi:nickel/cobalt exporter
MSVITSWNEADDVRTPKMALLLRLSLAVAATIIVGAGLAALGALLDVFTSAPVTDVRNPFGVGLRERAPNTGGIGGVILIAQAHFYAALTATVSAIRDQGASIFSLAIVGFTYGIFHAAGPGHGKALISAYIVTRGRSLSTGAALSLSTALLQASVAIVLVSVLAGVMNATNSTINTVASRIEFTSFLLISLIGAYLVWSKAGALTEVLVNGGSFDLAAHERGLPVTRQEKVAKNGWGEFAAVVVGGGIRPCTGAIILLVFSYSQDLYLAGIIGTLFMALGTAITTGTLASMAALGKGLLVTAAKGGNSYLAAIAALELLAAAFVLAFGLVLLTGLGASFLPAILD